MKTRKLISSLLLTAVLSTVFFSGVVSADMREPSNADSDLDDGDMGSALVDSFSDIYYGDDNFAAVDYLRASGVVQGYDDGTYKPDNKINRAEFLKIVMEATASEAVSGGYCYPDVKDQWFAKYVCEATELGLVKGYDDGNFRPEQEINFVEASKIVANALDLELDENASGEWYEKYVEALEGAQAIPKSISSFSKDIDRGEMAEIIWRLKEEPAYVPFITSTGIERKMEEVEADGDLLSFDSCVELKDYLTENSSYYDYGIYDYAVYEDVAAVAPTVDDASGEGSEADDGAVVSDESAGVTAGLSAPEGEGERGGGSEDYSTTNVQVEGVDEADIVKNDGEYIYVVKGATVRVVRAYPPTNMDELDKVTFSDESFYPYDLYVDGDRLVVLGYSYSAIYTDFLVYEEGAAGSAVVDDYDYYGNTTKVYIFDISDKSNIELMRQLSFEGDYTTSRKVDDMVYLVTNKTYSNYYFPYEDVTEPDVLPLYGDSESGVVEPISDCGDVWYVPGIESTNYLVISGIPIDDAAAAVAEEVVLGSSGTVYASRENLYVAESSSYWGGWWWDESQEDEETTIHKFKLGRNDIEYKGQESVPGTILNQFSMDEYMGNFRIATTVGHVWDTDKPSTSNLYILNENLSGLGSIEGIAPGETIYSVRFLGDRAYMVTFKKVDPFFVIDVSDPSNPAILGSLKIPGFSDYLHPFDENHIIGFGKEAIDASDEDLAAWGRDFDFAWYQGLKIAMFDVTDVSNPVELHRVIIGDRGTESALLYDHKALLFDKERGLMALPVTLAEIPQTVKDDPNFGDNTYGEFTFQGAYVYNVSVENGFDYKGRISHYNDDQLESFDYYWYGDYDIARILWIGDYLYSVSYAIIKANNKSDLAEVASLELEAEPEDYYDYGGLIIE